MSYSSAYLLVDGWVVSTFWVCESLIWTYVSMDSFLCGVNKLRLETKALGSLSNSSHLLYTSHVQETIFCAPNRGSLWASQQDEEMQIQKQPARTRGGGFQQQISRRKGAHAKRVITAAHPWESHLIKQNDGNTISHILSHATSYFCLQLVFICVSLALAGTSDVYRDRLPLSSTDHWFSGSVKEWVCMSKDGQENTSQF